MAVIFMLPRAEEMYLLFALDGCHFYAAKSWRNVFIICSSWLSFLCSQELKNCIYINWLSFLSCQKLKKMYIFFAQDSCHIYAVKSWWNVFIICSGWLSYLCCQELKKCIYYLLRMVVIFMLLRAEHTYYLLRMVVILSRQVRYTDPRCSSATAAVECLPPSKEGESPSNQIKSNQVYF